jgi:hypothetical protein
MIFFLAREVIKELIAQARAGKGHPQTSVAKERSQS